MSVFTRSLVSVSLRGLHFFLPYRLIANIIKVLSALSNMRSIFIGCQGGSRVCFVGCAVVQGSFF